MEKFFKTLPDDKKILKTSYTKLHGKHLGRGALGEVYEGTLRIPNKKPVQVALKEMIQVSSYQDHEVELIKGLDVPTNGAARSRVGVGIVGKVLFSGARELIFSH